MLLELTKNGSICYEDGPRMKTRRMKLRELR